MYDTLKPVLQAQLAEIRAGGLYKNERILASPQAPEVTLEDGRKVLVFCANNYLGLSSHPAVIAAAHRALDSHGYGLSSVRFICGTQDLHKQLEARIAEFLGLEDAILYAACFDANVTVDLVKELAKRKPLRAVFRDSSYASDSTKINVEQIFKLVSPATEVKSL